MSTPEVRLPHYLSNVWEVDQLLTAIRTMWDSHYELHNSLTTVLYAEPAKLYEGLFAFADGTDWDPGSGRGLYQYVSGAWQKL